ncbi:hypothetical protein Q8A67_011568 [Cirrhinus molitorella]|uniref:Uncharacterized protein n=1 Tax=Cirrhinus molitorella TaxID=172907 RepID=A0AA88PKU6_9TELE|nr:hypothetical protein Q8A67_011568 [Cirrhinus molitorella]
MSVCECDDTFELHSVQVELEAVEKQIRQLLERQAELRAALESSRIPAILKDESVGAIVLHAGVNDIRLRQTEVLKRDFGSLIETVRSTAPETRIIVSGPLPTYRRGHESVVLLHVCLDKPQEDCVSVDYSDCADSGLHCQLVESRLGLLLLSDNSSVHH